MLIIRQWSYEHKDFVESERSKILPKFDQNAPKVPAAAPMFTDIYMDEHPQKRDIRGNEW